MHAVRTHAYYADSRPCAARHAENDGDHSWLGHLKEAIELHEEACALELLLREATPETVGEAEEVYTRLEEDDPEQPLPAARP